MAKERNRVIVEQYEGPSVGMGKYSDRIAINPWTDRYIARRRGKNARVTKVAGPTRVVRRNRKRA